MLKVDVDKRASMAWLKRHLEVFVGVPCDYFKVVKSNDEYDYTSLSPSFRDGDRINVRLGRVLRKGEYLGKVFQLMPNDPEVIYYFYPLKTNIRLTTHFLSSANQVPNKLHPVQWHAGVRGQKADFTRPQAQEQH